MQKFFVFFLMWISLVLFSEQGFSQSRNLASPDGRIRLRFSTGRQLNALLSYDLSTGQPVLQKATIGVAVRELGDAPFALAGVKTKKVSRSWTTVVGERKSIPENYNELQFSFRATGRSNASVVIVCRAYNEGFAFRYTIRTNADSLHLQKEESTFPLCASDATAWVSNFAQAKLVQKKIGDLAEAVERPLTIRTSSQQLIALGEAALTDFARMKFRSTGTNTLQTQLYEEVKGKQTLASPWRYVLCAASPADLLEKNYLLLNLNEPARVRNTSWIQPGTVLREATLTTAGSFASIDFAAAHHIRYICFDAGWYGKEDSDTADATRVSIDPARGKGPLDLQKVIAYGKQKGVGVILYVNRRALERQLDTLLPLYQSWGVKGLKFGFVQVGSQHWTTWLHEAVRKAAEHQLVVDIHDEYRPTGFQRTYPNLLTQEGIRGDEESPFVEHSITTLFTRMIAGPADNTICYFTNRVNKMGSHVAQMAKSVCLFSPLQFLFWYDRPVPDSVRSGKEGEIQEVPEMSWFNSLPTSWEETKVLEGDMEAFATIARKKNGTWFLGSLNGQKQRSVSWPLTFLDKNKTYLATIYTDDPGLKTPTQVRVSTQRVTRDSVLAFSIGARNGVAIRFTPRD
ncbi:glycoside hydrolase family 97 protein [Flavisolibacter nicotianae]|uniref:glycoside hydrolase family 97 protein n=1 Tax=Flavisolibacter nicotianae TaxID=2364882 RepID=UPI000EB3EC90|nr:glycoside hydrolase family 97 protein [Flavisolibacter nicotianae]